MLKEPLYYFPREVSRTRDLNFWSNVTLEQFFCTPVDMYSYLLVTRDGDFFAWTSKISSKIFVVYWKVDTQVANHFSCEIARSNAIITGALDL